MWWGMLQPRPGRRQLPGKGRLPGGLGLCRRGHSRPQLLPGRGSPGPASTGAGSWWARKTASGRKGLSGSGITGDQLSLQSGQSRWLSGHLCQPGASWVRQHPWCLESQLQPQLHHSRLGLSMLALLLVASSSVTWGQDVHFLLSGSGTVQAHGSPVTLNFLVAT